jgi:putative ABC transport system permease protein
MFLIIGQGFIAGMSENILRTEIDASSGHVLATPARYPVTQMQHPVDELLRPSAEAMAWLDANSEAWVGRLVFSPTGVVGPRSLRLRAIGFDPAKDPAVFPRDAWDVVGELPAAGRDEVAISPGVARLLEVKVGEAIVLKVRTTPGAVNARRYTVTALVSAGNPWFDRFGVMMPLDVANDLVQADGQVSHLAMRLSWRTESGADAAAAALRPLLGDQAQVETWMERTADMMALQHIRQRALNVMVGALLVMAATGIANTILMAAWERVREIGTLQAMGMDRRDVLKLFLVEGALMGSFGSFLGASVGIGVVLWFSAHGIDFTEETKTIDVPISATLYMALDPFWSVAAPVYGVVVAMLASIWPARVASAMPPAEAVRA